MEKQFNLILKAINDIQEFKKYIEQIKKESNTPLRDLQDLELILQTHTSKQVFEFMPRFISLL